jgi:preprotein translocase subunit SecA
MAMMDRGREETVEYIFRVQIMPQMRPRPSAPVSLGAGVQPAKNGQASKQPQQTPQKQYSETPSMLKKIGRNDPCPCGSGKKYKKCCGK